MNTEDQPPKPLAFPQYSPPTGLPIAHPKQASVMMKAIKQTARAMARKLPGRRKGLTSRDSVHIGKRKTKWY